MRGEKPGEPPGTGEEEAELVPHTGMVRLHPGPAGSWSLSRNELFELVALPQLPQDQKWVLSFDGEGFSYLEVEGGDEMEERIIFGEDLFTRALYEFDDGKRIIVSTSGQFSGDHVKLDDFKAKFVESKARLSVGDLGKAIELDLFVFKWPRSPSGNRLFISMKSLYPGMNLSQYNGEGWRWVFSGFPKWSKTFDKLKVENGLEKSALCSKNKKSTKGDPEETVGFLPASSVSTPGIFVLLDRWAYRDERACGFHEAQRKSNATALQQSLRPLLWEGKPWRCRIDLVDDWSYIWPSPECWRDPVTISISDSSVDLSEWRFRAREDGAQSVAGRSWAALYVDGDRVPPFFEFLKALGNPDEPALYPLYMQFVHSAGRLLQDILVCSTNGTQKIKKVKVDSVGLGDLFQLRSWVDSYLLKYVHSAQARSADQQYWSLCSDKAACGVFKLQAGLAVFPNNLAIVAPPVVLLSAAFFFGIGF